MKNEKCTKYLNNAILVHPYRGIGLNKICEGRQARLMTETMQHVLPADTCRDDACKQKSILRRAQKDDQS